MLRKVDQSVHTALSVSTCPQKSPSISTTCGDIPFEDEVLGLFLAQLPEAIASLKSAANPRDWKIAAHGLKGSSRAVGAWRIATLAQEAEALAAVRETEECRETISRLEAAVSEASNFVRAFAERR